MITLQKIIGIPNQGRSPLSTTPGDVPQRDRDFGSPELERGIHFRDVSYILRSLDGSTFRISSGKIERENKENLNEVSILETFPIY